MASGRAKGELGPPIAPDVNRPPNGAASRSNDQAAISALLKPLPAAKKEAMRRAIAEMYRDGTGSAEILKQVREAVAHSK